MRFRLFLSLLLASLLLTACFGVSRSVSVPAVPAPAIDPALTAEEKVVALATATAEPGVAAPTATAAAAPEEATPTSPAETPSPRPAPGVPLAEQGIAATTYHNPVDGFAIDYPADWEITAPTEDIMRESMGYSISLRKLVATRPPKWQEGLLPGDAAVDVAVIRGGEGMTHELAVAERRKEIEQGYPNTRLALEEEWLLPGGLRATRWQVAYEDGQSVAMLITVIGGNTVMVTGFGDQALFDAIAGSIREE